MQSCARTVSESKTTSSGQSRISRSGPSWEVTLIQYSDGVAGVPERCSAIRTASLVLVSNLIAEVSGVRHRAGSSRSSALLCWSRKMTPASAQA